MITTTSPLTATQGYPVPRPSLNATTGGPACDRKSTTMSAGVQTVSGTRSTHRQGKPHLLPFSHNQKHCHSRRSQWTSLLSYHSRTASILYSPSPTTTALRQPFSSHATKPSQPKEWQNFTSNTCSNGSDSHGRSSAIGTRDWRGSSPKHYAQLWESLRTCQQCSTPEWTGSRSTSIKGWSNICGSTSTPSKATGCSSYR
jgi:hypothetical protein